MSNCALKTNLHSEKASVSFSQWCRGGQITELQLRPHRHLLQLVGSKWRRQNSRRSGQTCRTGIQERDHPWPRRQGQHLCVGFRQRRTVQGQLQLRRIRDVDLHDHCQQHVRVRTGLSLKSVRFGRNGACHSDKIVLKVNKIFQKYISRNLC